MVGDSSERGGASQAGTSSLVLDDSRPASSITLALDPGPVRFTHQIPHASTSALGPSTSNPQQHTSDAPAAHDATKHLPDVPYPSEPALVSDAAEQQYDPYEPPFIHLSALLDICPPEHDARFWQSPTWRQSVRALDSYFFFYVATNNATLYLHSRKWPKEYFPYIRSMAYAYLLLGALHSWGAATSATSFYQVRGLLVAVNRVMRLVNICLDVMSFRKCSINATCVPFIVMQTHRPDLPPLSAAFRALSLVSLAYPALLHTTYLRFQFRMQALFQLAYLFVIYFYASVAATHFLSDPFFRPALTSICHFVDAASTFVILQATGVPPAPTSTCDSRHAPWLLVLFSQSFFGCVVPLVITYCLEHRLKKRYLSQELQQANFGATSALSSLVWAVRCVVLIMVYAVLVWLLLQKYYPVLARWALPTEWPGAESRWYHDLVG